MNLHGWADWALAHQGRLLFLVFLLLGVSHAIVAIPAGLKIIAESRHMQYKFVRLTGQLLLGIGSCVICTLIANVDPTRCIDNRIHFPPWFGWWLWTGQACLWLPACRLSLYIIRPWNPDKPFDRHDILPLI